MLISKTVKMKWNPKNKKRFVDLGYTFTKMEDEFEVSVEHLSRGSWAEVIVRCDYCGKIYTKRWYNYLRENSGTTIHKDCCKDCKTNKTEETCLSKYGVNTVFRREDILQQIKETNLKLYGSENVFSSEIIKERIYNTNISKYGSKSPMQNKDILEKESKTCQERYGVPFYVITQVFSGEQNPRWKGGYEYHRIERATSEYINWRKEVYAKNNYTCQCCGDKSSVGNPVTLNAHHIKNWKDYPDYRYDIDNGITLCERCHLKFHQIYGKHNNTMAQLEDFLINQGKKIC